MRVEQFFYAIEIADTGSFSQAARNLYVSQPNLSHAVKQIEQQVGFPLFVRTPSGVIPTPEGSALIDRFRVLKREYDQLEAVLHRPAPPRRLRLRVAVLNSNRANRLFAETAQRYITSPISFSFLKYSYLEDLLPLVETCQIDFAIIGTLSNNLKNVLGLLSSRSIEYHPLTEDPICALVGPENPLYQEPESVRFEQLYPYPVVQYGDAARDPSHCLPYATGLSAHAAGEILVNHSNLFYSIIQNTPAVGLLAYQPEAFLRQGEWSGVRLLPISDAGVTAHFGWIKLRRLPLSDIAAEVLESVQRLF